MRKVLMVLGGLFLAIIVIVAGLAAYAFIRGPKIDAESKAYLRTTAPLILAQPTADNLTSYMAPEDRAKVDSAALAALSSYMTLNLGGYEACGEWSGGWNVNESTSGETINSNYQARCQFSKASIIVQISIRKTGDIWRMVGIHLDSKSLKQGGDAKGQGI